MTVPDLQSRLDETRTKAGVVGAGIAVLHEGEITAAASGVLNRATGVEATTDSLFQIGSITKAYTATVVMQLVDEGLLHLDTPVREILPQFRVADAGATAQITVRHLLTHTAGFDGDHFADHGRGDDVLERYAASCAELVQITPVGGLFSYNNAAFSVLGRVIEQLTGQVWDVAMRERVFQPLELTHTATLPEDVLRHRAAIGHLGPDLQPVPQWGLPRSVGPAGLICATATDVVSFARMHLTPTRLLSEESVRAMRQPAVDIPEPEGGLLMQTQGLGWSWNDHRGVTVVGHDGGTIGQSARLRFVPATGTAVALLTNGGDILAATALVDELLHELADVVPHPPLEPRQVGAPDVARWTGRYARTSHTADVRVENDALVAHHEMSRGGVVAMSSSAELLPYDPERGVFLTRIEEVHDAWLAVTFLNVEGGPRVLHFNGRPTPLVAP